MVEMKNACRILDGDSEGKRTLGKPRRRWRTILILILKKWG
jgi:hypothetical protein